MKTEIEKLKEQHRQRIEKMKTSQQDNELMMMNKIKELETLNSNNSELWMKEAGQRNFQIKELEKTLKFYKDAYDKNLK